MLSWQGAEDRLVLGGVSMWSGIARAWGARVRSDRQEMKGEREADKEG